MSDQRIQDEHPTDGFSEEQLDSIVLDFMLCDQSCPWTVQELGRELGHHSNAVDAVRRLTATGLVHRSGEFVFPTRTARRANDIKIGTAPRRLVEGAALLPIALGRQAFLSARAVGGGMPSCLQRSCGRAASLSRGDAAGRWSALRQKHASGWARQIGCSSV